MVCWRVLTKLYKNLWILLVYYVLYSVVMVAFTPDVPTRFVGDELRVGDKYALVYLETPEPVFTDRDGVQPFESRCGKCFITNNKGFVPLEEYDAILALGDRSLFEAVAMEPAKRYLMDVTTECLEKRFLNCSREPKIVSYATRETYTLCSLCEYLSQQKR